MRYVTLCFCWVCMAWSHGRFITCVRVRFVTCSSVFRHAWNRPQVSSNHSPKNGKKGDQSATFTWMVLGQNLITIQILKGQTKPVFLGFHEESPVVVLGTPKNEQSIHILIRIDWNILLSVDPKNLIVRNHLIPTSWFSNFFPKWFRSPRRQI